jgi:hypothetical protein
MSIFQIEISTSSEFPTVDAQHLLFELAAQLEVRFGGARREEIEYPIEFFVEGISGTLYFRSVEAEAPPEDVSEVDYFLDEISRRLNEEDDEDEDEDQK